MKLRSTRYNRRLFSLLLPATAALLLAQSALAVPPANDNFANAQALVGPFNVQGNNTDATSESGEPIYVGGTKTAWYKWTSPGNLSMTVETQNSGTLNDTILGIFSGSAVNALTQVAYWSDDINGSLNRKSRVTFVATAGSIYYFQVSGAGGNTGAFLLGWSINQAESSKQFNFDGIVSTTSDLSVFRSSDATWYMRYSAPSTGFLVRQWGQVGDQLVPGDYDGDGSTDVAVWRPATGTFYVSLSLTGSFLAFQWGMAGDRVVQGDFDGDDKADFAVWRQSNGTFYVRNSSNGSFSIVKWGQTGDALACGDYDGDGRTDFGIQRPQNGLGYFYVLLSSNGSFLIQQFGLPSDFVYPGDIDGDGKNDIAVYRTTPDFTFYTLRSSDGGFHAVQWGTQGDFLVPGSYGGSVTRGDLCVWRPSNGTFYCYTDGGTGPFLIAQWGLNGDTPIATSNVH